MVMRILAFLICFAFLPLAAAAQDKAVFGPFRATEAGEKGDQPLPRLPFKGPVVIELFSSQACVFCPKADALFNDLVQIDSIIGFSCHVPYNDVIRDSLSRDFCTGRQTYYQETLRSGPNYTPQMVVNGRHDVVAHRLEDVTKTIHEAATDTIQRLTIKKLEGQEKDFETELPALKEPIGPYDLWLALIDKPHSLTIAEGNNKGTSAEYRNIASHLENMGAWDGMVETLRFDIKFAEENRGFILLAQHRQTGAIVAAGKYILQ